MSRILLRRGNKVDLPVLNAGEPGLATDTKELFIGHSSGNLRIPIVPSLAAAPWIAPTLLNAWVNFGASIAPVGYYKDDVGVVRIRGGIKSGTLTQATSLFTLPAGYRPLFRQGFTVDNNGAAGTVTVEVNGNVAIDTVASSVVLWLDAISFRAEQ